MAQVKQKKKYDVILVGIGIGKAETIKDVPALVKDYARKSYMLNLPEEHAEKDNDEREKVCIGLLLSHVSGQNKTWESPLLIKTHDTHFEVTVGD